MIKAICFLLFISTLIITSCKKEEGRFFLRIIPPADSTISSLTVSDAQKTIQADSNYYPVEKYLKINYELHQAIKYEIKDWTSSIPYNQYTYEDVTIKEYLGEFEKREKDKYYTLIISYRIDKGEPILNTYANPSYYFYAYDYYDESKLTWTENP